MKRLMTIALVVLMGAVSCTRGESPGGGGLDYSPSTEGLMTFRASFGTPSVRVTPQYEEEVSGQTVRVLWDEDDQVGVYDADGAPKLFTADSDGEETTLEGSADDKAGVYYAMYPYDTQALVSGGVIATVFPAEQRACADAFSAHYSVAVNSGLDFYFSNVCAMMRVYVGCEHVTSITFEGNRDEYVAGDVEIDAATASYELAGNMSRTLTILPPQNSQVFAPGHAYYFPILPMTFKSGYTVTLNLSGEQPQVSRTEYAGIPRSAFISCPEFSDITGDGTEASPYRIASLHNLLALRGKLEGRLSEATYVRLETDIDMSSVDQWTPICNDRTLVNIPEIHFDGGGHTISNFAPTDVTDGIGGNQASFFGILYGSCRNLNITSAVLDFPTKSTVAVLAGFAGYNGKDQMATVIEDVHVSGRVSGQKVVAGFVGQAVSASFLRCTADVHVTAGDSHAGGFVARCIEDQNAEREMTFEECCSRGDVINNTRAARFTGGFYGGTDKYYGTLEFRKCYSTGNVKADYQAGSLIGYVHIGPLVVENCYAVGDVVECDNAKYSKQFGGIIGTCKASEVEIRNCYYNGMIVSNFDGEVYNDAGTQVVGRGERAGVGGIVGINTGGTASSLLSGCFSSGNLSIAYVDDTWGVGGIIGAQEGSLRISDCYTTASLFGSKGIGGIAGYTLTATTFENCGFGGSLPGGASNCGSIAGRADVANTYAGCWYFNNQNASSGAHDGTAAIVSQSDYNTASKVAARLGWDTGIWNLSGVTPTLKCFEN